MSSVHVTLAVRPISTAWVEEEEPLFARHLGDPAPGESDPWTVAENHGIYGIQDVGSIWDDWFSVFL